MIHYPTLKKEVLVAIRGKFSRSQCSEKLGFTFNKVQRWESGKAEINWPEFIDLARVCKKEFPADLKNYSVLLQKIIPEKDIDHIATQLSISKNSLRAWLKGKRIPKLVHMLQILHEHHRSLIDIIGSVVDLEKIPSLQKEIEQQKKLRTFHHQFPFTAGIFALLEWQQHQAGFVYKEGVFVQLFKITLPQEKEWIRKAKELELIELKNQQIRLLPAINTAIWFSAVQRNP